MSKTRFRFHRLGDEEETVVFTDVNVSAFTVDVTSKYAWGSWDRGRADNSPAPRRRPAR